MAEQQQSIKVIFDKIMRHPLLQDLSIETIVDYSIDFMRIVGVPSMFEEKVEKAEVINYRVSLPCDYYQMIQIRALDPNYNILGAFRYSSDSFHMSNTKPEYADYSYKADKLRAARAASASPSAPTATPPVAPATESAAAPRVKARVRTGGVPRMLTAPHPEINPLSLNRWWQ